MQAANKNPPWARATGGSMDSMNNANMAGSTGGGMVQYGAGGAAGMYASGMMHNAAGANMMGMQGAMPMGQMAAGGMYPANVVAYPTPRGMNAAAFAGQTQPPTAEQRVFTGVVTKTHNDFGFVDHDVFYQTSVCAKGALPKVNDRVLVEATYNANMPFKWNATRVQVLSKNVQANGGGVGSGYNAVPPPSGGGAGRDADRFRKNTRRDDAPRKAAPKRSATPAKRQRSKSPVRPARRRESPPRKRSVRASPVPAAKFAAVRVPRIPLDISELDVPSMIRRYTNLYIPSDFFHSNVRWRDAFPPQYPFSLHNQSHYHIMDKEVPDPRPNDAILEPPDADYRFSAKVMLISLPSLESLYQKCGLTKSDSKDKRDRDGKVSLHPTRLIKFLVGQKGKSGDNFAIGGPWSPSLDGPDPASDPSVLVKTAIRTTKALTGMDLSPCTQWFRMVEFYYWREGSGDNGGRLETVVLFLPDVWSAMPSKADWGELQALYERTLEAKLHPPVSPAPTEPDNLDDTKETLDSSTASLAESQEDDTPKKEPTHYSQLDLRTIKVDQLREELDARGLSNKGLRAQLLARLSKVVRAEEEAEKKKEEEKKIAEAETEEVPEKTQEPVSNSHDEVVEIKDGKDDVASKDKVSDKEIAAVRARYTLPTVPHLMVHPSSTARGGKFTCSMASLSLLLDYRSTDNKEHSFEIFVFAELFNEMLQRDFGFYIYKTLYMLPEKEEDKKDKKKEDDKDKKKEEDKDKKKEEDKKKEDDKDKKKEDDREKKKEDDDKKKADCDKKESVEVERRQSRGVELPTDPYLLLSLVYFDTARGSVLHRRDLQTLFMALGLQLSRSQLKHLLDKVCSRDETFDYRSLVSKVRDPGSHTVEQLQDLPLDTLTTSFTSGVEELEAVIACGNRDLLPVFDDGSAPAKKDGEQTTDSGMVVYQSRLVDVGATLAALARSERRVTALETACGERRVALRAAREAAAREAATARGLATQLATSSADLTAARASIARLKVNVSLLRAALQNIKKEVEGVIDLKIGSEQADDDVVEVVHPAQPEESSSKKEEVLDESEKIEEKENAENGAQETPGDEPLADQTEPENMDIDDK